MPGNIKYPWRFMIINSKWSMWSCILIPLCRASLVLAQSSQIWFNENCGFAKWYVYNKDRGGKRVEGLCTKWLCWMTMHFKLVRKKKDIKEMRDSERMVVSMNWRCQGEVKVLLKLEYWKEWTRSGGLRVGCTELRLRKSCSYW